MGREIKIKIASEANLAAIRQVNTELVQMGFILGKRNRDLSNDARRALADYTSLGAGLEKTAYKSVLSAKQIEEAWKKAMAKPTDEAARGFGKLKGIAEGAINGIGGSFKQLAQEFGRGGIWGLAANLVVSRLHWRGTKSKRAQSGRRNEPSALSRIASPR